MIEEIPESLSDQSKYFMRRVQEEPASWVLRKEAALQLYEDGAYTLAAEVVWSTPEIPSTDMDVAFAVKIISRAKPNRSIRMIYELMLKNSTKAEQMIALANVFNLVGFPMLAARSYGAAVALNPEYFDVGFEAQAFFEDSGKGLQQRWLDESESSERVETFDAHKRALVGEPIEFGSLKKEINSDSFMKASEAAAKGDVAELVPAFKKLQNLMHSDPSGQPRANVIVPPSKKMPVIAPPIPASDSAHGHPIKLPSHEAAFAQHKSRNPVPRKPVSFASSAPVAKPPEPKKPGVAPGGLKGMPIPPLRRVDTPESE